jgi:DNA recombination protein RmuC
VGQVNRVVSVLDNPTVRGRWGEVMLDELLRIIGYKKGEDYDVQVPIIGRDGKEYRPDFVIYLSNGYKLCMDSKFSVGEGRELVSRLKQRIVEAKKYIACGEKVLDFVILYIPNEGVYNELLHGEMELFKKALGEGVILASPINISGLLYILRYNVALLKLSWAGNNAIQQLKDYQGTIDNLSKSIHSVREDVYRKLSAIYNEIDKLRLKLENVTSKNN